MVGVGGQGKYHVSTVLNEPDVNMVGVCNVFKICSYKDAENMKVGNIPDANRLIHTVYSNGWTL